MSSYSIKDTRLYLTDRDELSYSEFGFPVEFERLFTNSGPTRYFVQRFGGQEIGVVSENYTPIRVEPLIRSLRDSYSGKIKDILIKPIGVCSLRVDIIIDLLLRAPVAEEGWPERVRVLENPPLYEECYPALVFFISYRPGKSLLKFRWVLRREIHNTDIPFGPWGEVLRKDWVTIQGLKRRLEGARYENVQEILKNFNSLIDKKKKFRCSGLKRLVASLGYPRWIYFKYFQYFRTKSSMTFWEFFALCSLVRRFMRKRDSWGFYAPSGAGGKTYNFILKLLDDWKKERKRLNLREEEV